MKQYEYKGRIYSVVNCTMEDIPSHIERVSSYWESANVDIQEQTKLLEQAINENTAFKLIDDEDTSKAFIYCIMMGDNEAQSNLMWLEDKRMFAMLCYYLRLTANIHIIYFKPHTKDYIPFEFVVQDSSIRSFHNNDTPLKIDLYSTKSTKLYEDHFLSRGIKELE